MDSHLERVTYQSEDYWKKYQKFFPVEWQITEANQPMEEWWDGDGHHIHLDRMPAPASRLKVILIHGGGGNGRLLAPYARMLHLHGYEVVAPDLPPFGLSYTDSLTSLEYGDWVKILTEFIEQEFQRDHKPIVLLGASIGGMLAYNASCLSRRVSSLIVTTFVDMSRQEVRDQIAPNKMMSRAGKVILDNLPSRLDSLRIPISRVSRMGLITNNPELTQLIKQDPRAAGTKVPLRFLRTFLNMEPAVEPEQFEACPILLIHPEIDPMTPFGLSEPFYERLQGRKSCVILEGAGHLPIEQPGVAQMERALLDFLSEVES